MPKAGSLLLDLFPNAAVAYSLRKLRTAYTGSAIRVRRSSDNTEQDIGFVGNNLDTASLLTFCGAGNGFVVTWYDQSTNGNNATQATAGNQPRIVINGNINLVNSKPSLLFNNQFLNTVVSISSISHSKIVVSKQNSTTLNSYVSLGQTAVLDRYEALNQKSGGNNEFRFRNTTEQVLNSIAVTNLLTLNLSFTISSTNRVLRTNANEFSSNINVANFTGNRLFINRLRDNNTQQIGNSDFSEVIVYNSNMYSSASGLEQEINNYYGIY